MSEGSHETGASSCGGGDGDGDGGGAEEAKGEPPKKKTPYSVYGGRYCCVVGCSKNQGRDVPQGIRFHQFPKQKERREQWVRAVNRKKEGSNELWQPGNYDVICSSHFLGGRKSDVEGSPSFVPTIFPTHHVRPKTQADAARFSRRKKFEENRRKVKPGKYE